MLHFYRGLLSVLDRKIIADGNGLRDQSLAMVIRSGPLQCLRMAAPAIVPLPNVFSCTLGDQRRRSP
jgi:hypothetical protein